MNIVVDILLGATGGLVTLLFVVIGLDVYDTLSDLRSKRKAVKQ